MTELVAASGETTHLNVLDVPDVIFLDQVLAPRTIRMEVKVGTRMPAHVTAAGKALLAWQPEPFLEQLVATGLQRFTPQTVTEPAALRRELALVRRRGWASEVEEYEPGGACVAAPIHAGTSIPLAALSISGPTSRLRPRHLAALGQRVWEAAQSVTESLVVTPIESEHIPTARRSG